MYIYRNILIHIPHNNEGTCWKSALFAVTAYSENRAAYTLFKWPLADVTSLQRPNTKLVFRLMMLCVSNVEVNLLAWMHGNMARNITFIVKDMRRLWAVLYDRIMVAFILWLNMYMLDVWVFMIFIIRWSIEKDTTTHWQNTTGLSIRHLRNKYIDCMFGCKVVILEHEISYVKEVQQRLVLKEYFMFDAWSLSQRLRVSSKKYALYLFIWSIQRNSHVDTCYVIHILFIVGKVLIISLNFLWFPWQIPKKERMLRLRSKREYREKFQLIERWISATLFKIIFPMRHTCYYAGILYVLQVYYTWNWWENYKFIGKYAAQYNKKKYNKFLRWISKRISKSEHLWEQSGCIITCDSA